VNEDDGAGVDDQDEVHEKELSASNEVHKFACQICGKDFRSKQAVCTHIGMSHRGMTIKRVKESSFKCDLCDKTYTRRETLKAHKIRVHSYAKTSFPCTVCDKTYESRKGLFYHLRKFHVQCKHCKEFFTESSLGKHLEDKAEGFPCSKFNGKTLPDRHILCPHCKTLCSKIGLTKTAWCSRCSKEFKIPVNNLFRCEFCSKVLMSRHGVKIHIKIHH